MAERSRPVAAGEYRGLLPDPDLALGAWIALANFQQTDSARFSWGVLEDPLFAVDGLSAPLLPLVALLYLLTVLATLGAKVHRFSFSLTLVSEGILLATFSCQQPWIIIALLAAGTIPPMLELFHYQRPARVFVLHMLLFVGLLVAGQWWIDRQAATGQVPILGITLLTAAVFVRSGMLPVHLWMTELFEHASFGTALLFVAPMAGTYAAMRLVFPIAPNGCCTPSPTSRS